MCLSPHGSRLLDHDKFSLSFVPENKKKSSSDDANIYRPDNKEWNYSVQIPEELLDYLQTRSTMADLPYHCLDPRNRLIVKHRIRWHSDLWTNPVLYREFTRYYSAICTKELENTRLISISTNELREISIMTDFDSSNQPENHDEGSQKFLYSDREPVFKLKELILSSNQLTDINSLAEIVCPTFSTLSDHYSRCYNSLVVLDLSNNYLMSIPGNLCQNLPALKDLNIAGNRISNLTKELFQMPSLISLNASKNIICSIECNEDSKSALKYVELDENRLSEFPWQLFLGLQNLEKLFLSYNLKMSIHNTLRKKNYFFKLDLSNNGINSINDNFFESIVELEELNVAHNSLTSQKFGSSQIGSAMHRLTKLSCQGNFLASPAPYYISEFILKLPRLEELNIENNQLLSLPQPSIWSCTATLVKLNASKNSISLLCTDELSRTHKVNQKCIPVPEYWTKLYHLNLSSNKLSTIPANLGNLRLKYLNLSNNPALTDLPLELGQLHGVHPCEIHIKNNKRLPVELKNKLPAHLPGYLHDIFTNAVPYHDINVMVLGESRSGKTSIIRYLRATLSSSFLMPFFYSLFPQDGFSLDTASSNADAENEIDLQITHLKLPVTINEESINFKLAFWDFIDKSDVKEYFLPCFLNKRNLYIMCYDLSGGLDQVGQMPSRLIQFQSVRKVLVVGTGLDRLSIENRTQKIQQYRLEIKKIFRAFSKLRCSFVEVDATGRSQGVQQIVKKLSKILAQSKIERIPASFIRLKKALQKQLVTFRSQNELPVMNYGDLRKFASLASIDIDDKSLMLAVEFLHSSTFIFVEDPNGLVDQGLLILDSAWLLQMLASLVDQLPKDQCCSVDFGSICPKLPSTRQFLNLPHLQILLKKHREAVMVLLQKYEVVIPSKNATLLFPHMLAKMEISDRDLVEALFPVSYLESFNSISIPKNNHNFIIRVFLLRVLPRNLWPRLIVRTENYFVSRGCHLRYYSDKVMLFWQQDIYCLISHKTSKKNHFIIFLVPDNLLAVRVFIQVLELFNGLLNEWYDSYQFDSDLIKLRGLDLDQTLLWVSNQANESSVNRINEYAVCPHCVDVLLDTWSTSSTSSLSAEGRLLHALLEVVDDITGRFLPAVWLRNVKELMRQFLVDQNLCFRCEIDNGAPMNVSFHDMIPDISLSYLEHSLHLDESLLELEKTDENLLGSGTFGSVYKARYNLTPCAVKFFCKYQNNEATDQPMELTFSLFFDNYQSFRNELQILLNLNSHPSIVNLYAVARDFLVLELGPLGNLESRLQDKSLHAKTLLKYLITWEIADALNYLHSKNIINRDLKPQNVILLSFDTNTNRVFKHAKLIDFGVSQLLSPFGLIRNIGTLEYQAPQVYGKINYDLKADIYSCGVLIQDLLMDGHSNEKDQGVYNRCPRIQWPPSQPDDCEESYHNATTYLLPQEDGNRFSPSFCFKQWPEAHALIGQCLQRLPQHRPDSKVILEHLKRPQFFALCNLIPVSKECSINSLVIRKNSNSEIELFSSSGEDGNVQVIWYNMMTNASLGRTINDKAVFCSFLLSEDNQLILSTFSGRIWIYNLKENLIRCVLEFNDFRVLSLGILNHDNHGECILMGTTCGQLLIYRKEDLLDDQISMDSLNSFQCCINDRFGPNPIRCILTNYTKRICFLSSGCDIYKFWIDYSAFVSFNDESQFQMQRILSFSEFKNINEISNKIQLLINCFLFCPPKTILLSFWNLFYVLKYNMETEIPTILLNVKTTIQASMKTLEQDSKYRVSEMCTWKQGRFLAVVTGGGHLVLVDNLSQETAVIKAYKGSIRSLARVDLTKGNTSGGCSSGNIGVHKSYLILSGQGVRILDDDEPDNQAYVTVWRDDILSFANYQKAYFNARNPLR